MSVWIDPTNGRGILLMVRSGVISSDEDGDVDHPTVGPLISTKSFVGNTTCFSIERYYEGENEGLCNVWVFLDSVPSSALKLILEDEDTIGVQYAPPEEEWKDWEDDNGDA
jgi:hypothetical protein|tara:strand:+ start:921 stop:1253 length:333 start_codon:yes stop_codon:yes gene_type:complete